MSHNSWKIISQRGLVGSSSANSCSCLQVVFLRVNKNGAWSLVDASPSPKSEALLTENGAAEIRKAKIVLDSWSPVW